MHTRTPQQTIRTDWSDWVDVKRWNRDSKQLAETHSDLDALLEQSFKDAGYFAETTETDLSYWEQAQAIIHCCFIVLFQFSLFWFGSKTYWEQAQAKYSLLFNCLHSNFWILFYFGC